MIPFHEVMIGVSTECHYCWRRIGAPALFIGLDGIVGCVQTLVGAVVVDKKMWISTPDCRWAYKMKQSGC